MKKYPLGCKLGLVLSLMLVSTTTFAENPFAGEWRIQLGSECLPLQFLVNPDLKWATVYKPEAFDELPEDALIGFSREDYAKCVEDFSKTSLKFYKVEYKSDGLIVDGFIGIPRNKPIWRNKHTAVIVNRGGNREFGRNIACDLIDMDYLFSGGGTRMIFAPEYRGVGGREGKDEFGGAEVNDVLNLLSLAKSYSFIQDVILAGTSRGGMMVYQALKRGAIVSASIAISAQTDLFDLEAVRPEMGRVFNETIPEIQTNRTQVLEARSAVFWPNEISSPLLIIHGTADRAVPVSHATRLADQLAELGKEHRLVVYPGAGHGLRGMKDQVRDEIDAWIQAHLTR